MFGVGLLGARLGSWTKQQTKTKNTRGKQRSEPVRPEHTNSIESTLALRPEASADGSIGHHHHTLEPQALVSPA